MRNDFRVTYAIITPESAEDGDVAEQGFLDTDLTLGEAIELCGGRRAYYEPDRCPVSRAYPPRWFETPEYSECYQTGERETRALHIPENVTPSSRVRIARLLGVKTA